MPSGCPPRLTRVILAIVVLVTPIAVPAASVYFIRVTPEQASLAAGECLQFQAAVYDLQGKRSSAAHPYLWATSDPTHYTVDAKKGVLCLKPGASPPPYGLVTVSVPGTTWHGAASVTPKTASPAPTSTPVKPETDRRDAEAVAPTVSSSGRGSSHLLETIDASAGDTAQRLQRDSKSNPDLLYRAVRDAGFSVRAIDGKLTGPVLEPEQGITFTHWQLASLQRSLSSAPSIPLPAFANVLAEPYKASGAKLAQRLVEEIQTHARGSKPALRFWARLIVELGRHADEPYDLLGPVDPAAVRLDPLQAALILKRLNADLQIAARAKIKKSSLVTEDRIVSARTFTDAHAFGRLMRVSAPRAKFSECNDDDNTIVPADVKALVIGKVVDLLDEAGINPVGKVGSYFGRANVALTYLKLIWSLGALDIQIAMDRPPLVRVKGLGPGERRELTATVRFDIGDWQGVNCVRQELNVIGLDFSLPADGAVAGAIVEWKLVEGGGGAKRVDGAYEVQHAIAAFENPGARIQEAGAGARHISNFIQSTTDKQGRAKIGLVGARRSTAMPENAAPVMKTLRVRVNVALEPATFLGTVADTTAGLPGLVTLPASLLLKTRWPSSPTFAFPVRDWEPCTGEWQGVVEQIHTFESNHSEALRYDSGVSRSRHRYSAKILANLSTEKISLPPEVRQIYDQIPRHVRQEIDQMTNTRRVVGTGAISFHSSRSEDRRGSRGSCSFHHSSEMEESGGANGPLDGSFVIQGNRYAFDLGLPTVTGTSIMISSRNVAGPKSCAERGYTRSTSTQIGYLSKLFKLEGALDPKKPNFIQGSKTVEQKNERITQTWDLVRCQ